jgi:3-dehydroquinate synthase
MRPANFQLAPLLIVVIVLLVPVAPFVIFGAWMESNIISWLESSFVSDRPLTVAAITTGLLTADILLPVPSSVVCTWAGRALGAVPGLIINWIGLTLSCLAGYWLARIFGHPIARRLIDAETLHRLENAHQAKTTWTLTVCRAVPVLAEASVLLAGLQKLPARQFYPPVIAANLGIAIAYSVLGSFSTQHGWFPAAIAISCFLPLFLLSTWKRSLLKLET